MSKQNIQKYLEYYGMEKEQAKRIAEKSSRKERKEFSFQTRGKK